MKVRNLRFGLLALALAILCGRTTQAAPVGHWAFDEASGSAVAADSSGNGAHGVLTNMNVNTEWVAGKLAGALHFDGTDDFVAVGLNAALNFGQQGTVYTWVNLDTTSGISTFYNSNSGAGGFQFRGTNGQPALVYSNIAGYTAAPTTLTAGTWVQTAVTYDNGDVVYYQGGKQVGTASGVNPFLFNDAVIGTWGGGVEPMKGSLDDLAVFNSALTPTHIAALHGLAELASVNAGDIAVDSVLSVFSTQTGTATAGSLVWGYATGLSGVLGDIGMLGNEQYIVLDSLGNGVMTIAPLPAPEPSSVFLLSVGLLGLASSVRRRQRFAA